jgi:26S proteasome regulatory subunit N10
MVISMALGSVDNSEWMRNGDYNPSRMVSQSDAINLISNSRTDEGYGAHPESCVGILTMGGRRYVLSQLLLMRFKISNFSLYVSSPEVLVTPTQDQGKILAALHHVKVSGSVHFASSIKVAQLALRHRQNKNSKQRIIAFVGSPLIDDETSLVDLGKNLKKNLIAVDIVNFGETAENQAKLEAFIAAVNKDENSNLLTVPAGPHILSDMLIQSPIYMNATDIGGGMASVPGAGAAMGGGGFEFGIDPNADPELAMALRISAEEAREREERERKATEGSAGAAGDSTTVAGAAGGGGDAMEDEDDQLQQVC